MNQYRFSSYEIKKIKYLISEIVDQIEDEKHTEDLLLILIKILNGLILDYKQTYEKSEIVKLIKLINDMELEFREHSFNDYLYNLSHEMEEIMCSTIEVDWREVHNLI